MPSPGIEPPTRKSTWKTTTNPETQITPKGKLRPRAPFVLNTLKSLENRLKDGLRTLAPPQFCYTVEQAKPL